MKVADRVYRSKGGKKKLLNQKTHTVHYGYVYDGSDMIDEVMVLIMKGPNSFTADLKKLSLKTLPAPQLLLRFLIQPLKFFASQAYRRDNLSLRYPLP